MAVEEKELGVREGKRVAGEERMREELEQLTKQIEEGKELQKKNTDQLAQEETKLRTLRSQTSAAQVTAAQVSEQEAKIKKLHDEQFALAKDQEAKMKKLHDKKT